MKAGREVHAESFEQLQQYKWLAPVGSADELIKMLSDISASGGPKGKKAKGAEASSSGGGASSTDPPAGVAARKKLGKEAAMRYFQ